MDIKTKDNIIIRNVPDGTPEEEIKARIYSIRSQRGEARIQRELDAKTPKDKSFEDIPDSERHQFQIKSNKEHDVPELQPRPAKSWDDRLVNDATRHYIGISELLTDPLLLGAHISDKVFGTDSVPAIQSKIDWLNKVKERAKAANRVEGIDFIGQGSKAGASILGLGKLKIAQTLFGKAAQGGLLGAYFGGTSYKPKEGEEFSLSDAATEAKKGAVVGAAVGPAIDVAGKVIRAPGNLYKHLTTGNPGSIAAKAAGDKVDDVTKALVSENSKITKLTAGQAAIKAKSPQFEALEVLAKKKSPEILGRAGVKGEQQATNIKVLEKIAKTGGGKESAIAARTRESSKLYKDAFGKSIKADSELAAMSKNPYFKDATKDAVKLAKAEGFSFKDNPTKFLHYVKVSIDKQLAKTGDSALGTVEKVAAQDLKKKLVSWIGKKNPNYEAARAKYAELSKPVNQAKIGEELISAIKANLPAEERAARFAKLVDDYGTKINKHTGKPVLDALSKQQKADIADVLDILNRNAEAKLLAKDGAEDVIERIESFKLPSTGIFKPLLSAARGWYNQASGHVTQKGLKELGKLMATDKEKLAKLMKQASPEQKKQISDVLQKYVAVPVIVGTSQNKER